MAGSNGEVCVVGVCEGGTMVVGWLESRGMG
jgi:hypothetical protein